MNSIVYVRMDVHKENDTVCCCSCERDKVEYKQTLPPDYRLILKYMKKMPTRYEGDVTFVCGCEAGCSGYSLYRRLKDHAVDCRISAPATMGIPNTHNVKTDRRDAANISGCPAFRTYSDVYVPDEEDNAVKDYIRMRDDRKLMLKKIKQQIPAFVLRRGLRYEGGKHTYWTITHVKWLRDPGLSGPDQETLSEYLITYDSLTEKAERPDSRTEEPASAKRYREKVKDMGCFPGTRTHTALSMIVEVGDFKRFEKAPGFASFPGLVQGEDSGSGSVSRYGITRAGNSHLRRLPAEAAQSYGKGGIGPEIQCMKRKTEGQAAGNSGVGRQGKRDAEETVLQDDAEQGNKQEHSSDSRGTGVLHMGDDDRICRVT